MKVQGRSADTLDPHLDSTCANSSKPLTLATILLKSRSEDPRRCD
jgi:hypothetical protein